MGSRVEAIPRYAREGDRRAVMQRRSFLTGASVVALTSLSAACRQADQTTLMIQVLQNSLPVQLVNQFRRSQRSPLKLDLMPTPNLQRLYEQLQTWSQTAPKPDTAKLSSLGDYWLAPAIRQGLIQPLQPDQLSHWPQLSSRWQALVTRDRQGNLSPTGQVWGAPYRWGATVMAYRTDKFRDLGWTPASWSDLWRPELQRRFSLLDQPREVIGLTLKKLGHSYNTEDLSAIAELPAVLTALNQQVKLYSSTAYLQPLIRGDTWLAVGWSTDILPVLREYDQIAVVMPQPGTALWADVWVDAAARLSDRGSQVSYEWMDFWWQPQVAQKLSQFSTALSPLLAQAEVDSPAAKLLLGDRQRFERSEFLLPLPAATLEQYRTLWRQMRQGPAA